jgi:two-component system phosphate regulon sensor histidine kinase PhoR
VKRIRINLIISSVAVAVLALLLIQYFQVSQLYDKKSDQLHNTTLALVERTALIYDKANNLNRYLSLSQKDFGQEYKEILKEEFKNLLSLNESIDIKDTSLTYKGKSEKYLIIKGNSVDSLSGISTEHQVMARDVRNVSQVFSRDSGLFPANVSYEMSQELDNRMIDQIFKKSKYISSLMLQMFRENTFDSANEKINLALLDSILASEVKRFNLPAKFQFSLLDEKLDPIEYETKAINYNVTIDTNDLICTNLFPGNILDDNVFLAVDFDSKTKFLIKEILGVLIISIGLVVIIFLTLGFMLKTIVKQKQLGELKNDFISNITHEFKTPISTISLVCQALEDSDMSVGSTTDSLPFVAMIKSENNRLSTLVETVLQISLMDRGEMKLDIETNNLTEIVSDISKVIQKRIESLNGLLTLDLPKEDIFIDCDELHTRQAILNLIDNAIKYSEDKPNVKIVLLKENTKVSLSVIDYGIGINKEHLPKIFDKLYRVPTGNVHNVKGFGLGLNYVDSIVKAHNWQLKVTSVLNRGSEFTLIMK